MAPPADLDRLEVHLLTPWPSAALPHIEECADPHLGEYLTATGYRLEFAYSARDASAGLTFTLLLDHDIHHGVSYQRLVALVGDLSVQASIARLTLMILAAVRAGQ
jgi:hypothetical protein